MAHIQLIGLGEAKSADGKIWKFPYAFPVIITELRKTKHSFSVFDTHLHKKTFQETLEFVTTCDANVFGISGWSHNYLHVKLLSEALRLCKPNAWIIVGGIIAGNDVLLLGKTKVDIIATGAEGEFILPEILDAIDSENAYDSLAGVLGITFRNKNINEIVKTQQRPTMSKEEFMAQDMPAYDYFDEQIQELADNVNTRNLPVKGFPFLTARGCPFQCTFCGHLYGQKFLRRKWDDFFAEIKFLIDRYGVQGFFSYDTNMFLTEKEVDEYCSRYKAGGFDFKMCAEMRTTFGSPEMFQKMKEHGILVALLGLESGSAYMLKRMKKGFNVDRMKEVILSAIGAGLMVHGNFIMGTPGESRSTVNDTAKFMLFLEELFIKQDRQMRAEGGRSTSAYAWGVLIPSPTSELYDLALQYGLIKDEEEYLLSLCDEENMALSKGSQNRIKLVDIGGDVNMSEFSSKEALSSYVRYATSLVKFKALNFYEDGEITTGYKIDVVKNVIKYWGKYWGVAIYDFIVGNRGFFDKEAEAKYAKYK